MNTPHVAGNVVRRDDFFTSPRLRSTMSRCACCLLLLCVTECGQSVRAAGQTSVGRGVVHFDLRDGEGRSYSMESFSKSELLVVAFVGLECPLAKLYIARLNEIAQRYQSRGVSVLGVDANMQDSESELAEFSRENQLTFPLCKDTGNALADKLGARRTPEVFVLDRDRVIQYRGRIDDQYGIDSVRPRPTREDLVEALEELLAGKQVSRPSLPSTGCLIGRIPQTSANAEVTWCNQVSRLVQRHCQACHRKGEVGPFQLITYEEAAGWSSTIREVVQNGRMPPWYANPRHTEFANDPRLSDEEKQLIYDWVDHGCPQGDPKDLPAPATFPQGWQIEPDEIFLMSPEPFSVPAKGIVDYQYYVVDPGFTDGKWIQAAECRPGNRSVVHHFAVFLLAPMNSDIPGQMFDLLAGYAPVTEPILLPQNAARYVPPGAKFQFVMHYTPNGIAQTDQSRLGVVYAKPENVKHAVRCLFNTGHEVEIPAHNPNWRIARRISVPYDCDAFALCPHMHLRGKSFTFEAIYPDHTRELLLDVPAYSFYWQQIYRLREPKPLPAGTVIECVGCFDNSAANPNNPDPSITVHWGEQTKDEMMDGFIEVALKSPRDPILQLNSSKGVGDRLARHFGSRRLIPGAMLVCVLGLAWRVRRSILRACS